MPEIALADVPRILRDAGLVTSADLLDPGLEVHDVSRRNRNFRALIGRERGYLLKCARDSDTRRTLAAEAAAYSAFERLDAFRAARQWVPRLHGWDEEAARLTLELLPAGVSLRELATPDTSVYTHMGRALATIHDAGASAQEYPPLFRPWIFQVHRPSVELFADISAANIRLVEIVQSLPDLCDALEVLDREWRSDTTIHSDVKWDNWVADLTDDGDVRRLVLVDWELAARGDTAWDIGSTLSEFFATWIDSVPAVFHAAPDSFDALARKPLARMRRGVRAFWLAYRATRTWSSEQATWTLLRAVRMAAARLLLRAWEMHQRSFQLNAQAIVSIQLASELVREPHLALVRILGIPLR